MNQVKESVLLALGEWNGDAERDPFELPWISERQVTLNSRQGLPVSRERDEVLELTPPGVQVGLTGSD